MPRRQLSFPFPVASRSSTINAAPTSFARLVTGLWCRSGSLDRQSRCPVHGVRQRLGGSNGNSSIPLSDTGQTAKSEEIFDAWIGLQALFIFAISPATAPGFSLSNRSWLAGVPVVKDYQKQLEKLRTDAAECKLISDLATDPAKRELFDRLALHLTTLADQVELAMIEAVKVRRG